jgi:signal transduction histidine kinase
MGSEIERMSHVLRGSLQGALLNVQALSVGLEGDADAQESIRLVREELIRAARMLLAAFEVVSLELGDVTRLDLRALVARALREDGLEGIAVSGGTWPAAVGDERLLSLAVVHLARNALAATPPARRAPAIRARSRRGGGVVLLVRDWGRGFGAATPPGRAFASARAGHAAAGLLMVERIARLHGGRVSFAAAAPGTEVRLSLPGAKRARR